MRDPVRAAGEPQKLTNEQVQLLAWAVSNCHTLARRRLNALRQRVPLDALLQTELESWEHVQRICEKAGAQSKGVLRASLPTEITDGSGASASPSDDGARQPQAELPMKYHVEPDAEGAGDWHVVTFSTGRRVQIFTQHPLVIVDPEVH